MKAFLIDPEARTVKEIDFDGDERSIPRLLGCRGIEFEQWPIGGSHTIGGSLVTRVYSDAKAIENSELHGFQVPETCGIIHHGLCLQVTYQTRSRVFVNCDVDVVKLKGYRIYEPGVGISGKKWWN
jgi:hypothetical protein